MQIVEVCVSLMMLVERNSLTKMVAEPPLFAVLEGAAHGGKTMVKCHSIRPVPTVRSLRRSARQLTQRKH
jgi:hypothetical protein